MNTFRSAITPAFFAVTAILSMNCANAPSSTGSASHGASTPESRAEETAIAAIEPHPYVDSCAEPLPGYARCHAKRRTDVKPFVTTPSGFGPADLRSAYNLSTLTGGSGVTVAIVDAQDDPSAEADLAVYRSTYGLPACTTANGCFKKVNQSGAASPLPSPDGGWAQEIALDLAMVSAACPSCSILLVEATSATTANLGVSVNTAVALGASVVSNSYGGSESSTDPADANSYFNHPGVLITASSGDESYGVEFPAAAPNVLAVGGTSLTRTSNARGWTEGVWSGAGSGCSAREGKPSWQKDTGCAKRTVADVSAVADPNTGVAVYETYQDNNGGGGGWLVFGGTSVSAPLVGAIFAATGHASATPQYPYANTGNFNDVTSGTNGTCKSTAKYLCQAVAGYDGPTGWGTPNGALMAAGAPPSNDFAIAANATTESIAQGASTTDAITTSVTSGASESIALSASGAPAGVTVSFAPASVSSGASSTMTIAVGPSVAAGTYTLTVTGTASSGAHAATVALTVTSTAPPPPNDFSVAATTATESIAQGASGTDAIATAVTSGAAESIALSASGAPAGVTVSFAPASVSSGASSTMTIAVGALATAGTYPITITGTAASGSHTSSVALTITPAVAPKTGIVNGTFATGDFTGWTESGAASSVMAGVGYASNDSAELGDYQTGTNGASNIAQTFVAPAGATKLTIVYAVDCFWKGHEGFKATLKDTTSGKTTTVVPMTCPARFAWTTTSVAITAGHTYAITLTNTDELDGSFSLVGQVSTK